MEKRRSYRAPYSVRATRCMRGTTRLGLKARDIVLFEMEGDSVRLLNELLASIIRREPRGLIQGI